MSVLADMTVVEPSPYAASRIGAPSESRSTEPGADGRHARADDQIRLDATQFQLAKRSSPTERRFVRRLSFPP